MFADEDFYGDNDLRAVSDIPPVTQMVDVWKVVARPFRKSKSGTIFWKATVAGKEFGPYSNTTALFDAVKESMRGNVKAGYRFGN